MKRLRHAHEDPRERALLLQRTADNHAYLSRAYRRGKDHERAVAVQHETAILYALARHDYISYYLAVTPRLDVVGLEMHAQELRHKWRVSRG